MENISESINSPAESIDQFKTVVEGWHIINQHSDPRCSARKLCRFFAMLLKASFVSLEYINPKGYCWSESVTIEGMPASDGHWYKPFPTGKSHWFFDGGRACKSRIDPVIDLLTKQWIRNEQLRRQFRSKKLIELELPPYDTAWITVSPAARKVRERLPLLYNTLSPILLIGEVGSGKNHLARLIHANGMNPFSSFSTQYSKSSANSDTHYITDWRQATKEKKSHYIKNSKRLIAAMLPLDDIKNVIDTWQCETKGHGLVLEVPALRYRIEDLPLLASHFLSMTMNGRGGIIPAISSSTLKILKSHVWPGNVRELAEMMTWTVKNLAFGSASIEVNDLPPAYRYVPHTSQKSVFESNLKMAEYDVLLNEIQLHKGNITRTAKALKLTPRQVSWRLKKHGINAKDYKPYSP